MSQKEVSSLQINNLTLSNLFKSYLIIFVWRGRVLEILVFKEKVSKLINQTGNLILKFKKKKSQTPNSTYGLELVKSVNIHMLMSGWEDIKP